MREIGLLLYPIGRKPRAGVIRHYIMNDEQERVFFTDRASTTHHGPRYFNFSFFCTMCDLEKLGLVDQNWLERNFSGVFSENAAGRR